jgi:5'-nucleotidase
MGVNKIILISHLQGIDDDLDLIPNLFGVDIVVAGGGDELLANEGDLLVPGDEEEVFGPYPLMATNADGAMVPVVTTSGQYKYIGQLAVEFDASGNVVEVLLDDSGPKRVVSPEIGDDGVGLQVVASVGINEPVRLSVAALDSNVIAQSEVGLDGVRGNVRTRETNQGNLITDAFIYEASRQALDFGAPLPDVALANGGGIRNDSVIDPGDITELDTFDMLPFSNFLVVIPEVPRSQFKEIMENAVSRVEFTDGRFAQIAGFTMVYDADAAAQVLNPDGTVATAGERVQTIMLDDGTMIVDNGMVVDGDPINIATVDFLARGGDQYPYRDAPFTILGVSYQQALASYITEGLEGVITEADYPEGGEGRIIRNN